MNNEQFRNKFKEITESNFRSGIKDIENNFNDLLESEEAKSLNFSPEQKQFMLHLILIPFKSANETATYSALQMIEEMNRSQE